jgi:hypothetical protein
VNSASVVASLLILASLAPALPAQVAWERQEEFRIISEAHAFDQRRGRLVHQSATTVADFPGDRTWEWLGEGPDQGWIERFPEQSPGPRNGRLAFDYARGKVVVFGTRLSPLNDFWEWDGNTWTQVNWTVGSTPNPFENICFVSDPVRKKIVLVGSVHFWETWEWDGVQWTSFGPDNPPIENPGSSSTQPSTPTRTASRSRATSCESGMGHPGSNLPGSRTCRR